MTRSPWNEFLDKEAAQHHAVKLVKMTKEIAEEEWGKRKNNEKVLAKG